MYLSRVEIDNNNRNYIRSLNHVGAYHDWVEQAFPEEISRGIRSRKLWRIDRLTGKDYLLVVSETKPDKNLLERYAVKESYACKDYSSFLNTIRAGEKYHFRVVLNPIHSVLEEGKKRGKVYPLYSEEDQLHFLSSRAEKYGFHINENEYMVTERGQEKLLKRGGKSANLVKAVYEGLLVVDNAEKFVELLINGMGREKAYGFGMMTVIRA